MKSFIWIVIFVMLLGFFLFFTGCLHDDSFDEEKESLEQPPTWVSAQPLVRYALPHIILKAESEDGYTWVKDKDFMLQGSVPDAVIDLNGSIRVYYVRGGNIEIARFDGQKWEFAIANLPTNKAVDPDVVLSDGVYRIYYFEPTTIGGDPAAQPGPHAIMMAESEDGVNFGNPIEVYADENITDPDVIKIGDEWFMYVSKGPKMEIASSKDGIKFEYLKDFPIEFASVSSTIKFDDSYRLFFHRFRDNEIKIYSAISTDGLDWKEEGVMLAPSTEFDKNGVADPSVVFFDGKYVMFYKSFE